MISSTYQSSTGRKKSYTPSFVTNNNNNDYLNFIKSNHNMIEKHLMIQFQHPYKKSLLKSLNLKNEKTQRQKRQNYKGIHNNKNDLQSIDGLQSPALINKNSLLSHRSIIKQNIAQNDIRFGKQKKIPSNLNPQKQSIYNSLNYFKTSQSPHKNINADSYLHPDLLSKDEISNIIQNKNREIKQALIKSKQNFSDVIYKNNLGENKNFSKSLNLQNKSKCNGQKFTLNYVGTPQTKGNHRYADQHIAQLQQQQYSENKNNGIGHLLLPIIQQKKIHNQQQCILENQSTNNSKKVIKIGPDFLQQIKQSHIQSMKNQYLSADIVKFYNKQIQQMNNSNNQGIKLYKKVEKNNKSLKIKQINNEKNLKSYYEYSNSLIKNQYAHLSMIQDEERKNRDSIKQVLMVQSRAKPINNNNDKTLLDDYLNNHQIVQKLDIKQQIPTIPQTIQQDATIQKDSSTPHLGKVNKKFSKVSKQVFNPPINKYSPQNTVYENKIKAYREYLFKFMIIYKKLSLFQMKQLQGSLMKNEEKFKFYIGKGNNGLLVKSLMKRRFWWMQVDDPKDAHFVWTQLKINTYYQYQKHPKILEKNYKIEGEDILQVKSQIKKNRKQKTKIIDNPQKQKKSVVFHAPLPQDDEMKIFTNYDKKIYTKYRQSSSQVMNSQKLDNFEKRLTYMPDDFFKNEEFQTQYQTHRQSYLMEQKVHNHLEFNHFIGNKKALFYNLRYFYEIIGKDVFNIVPLTFHIKKGLKDPEYNRFLKYYKSIQKNIKANQKTSKNKEKNVWIIKPGEVSNRGNGIQVFDELYEINNILKKKQKHKNGQEMTYIVQKYIEHPLLYKGRKFDIRHYLLITRLYGKMRVYFFGQGYIRTSSYEFNINDVCDSEIHLTNDAIQKHSENYGKYEEGNKLSYVEFQRYLDSVAKQENAKSKKENQKPACSFANQIYPQMRQIARQAVKSCYLTLDPNKNQHNFEVFGMDFMIDKNYKVWLIEINTNPCLELSSKLLERVIPNMLEQSFRLSLDILFPPKYHYPNTMKHLLMDYSLQKLKYELIFDQDRDGQQLEQVFEKQRQRQRLQNKKSIHDILLGEIDEDDETYENDGKEIVIGGIENGLEDE